MKFVIDLFSPVGLTRLIYVTLIICSAAVTGYFGKVMGSEFVLVPSFDVLLWTVPDLSMGFFTAAGFFAISVLSAVMAYHAGHMRALGQPEWKMVGQFAIFLLACDIFTNYMSWSTIRTQKAVISSNSNVVANDYRKRIATLRKTRADLSAVIQAPGAWIAVKDAEQALKETLEAQEREGKRVRCGQKCEELAAKARELRLEIAKSRTREDAIDERKKVDAQLVAALAAAKKNQVVIDPTNAQNEELASTFAGMKPSDQALFFAAKAIGLVGAIMFSLGASACGILLGQLTGAQVPRAQTYASPEHRTRYIAAPQGHQPQPLHETNSSVTVNYSGTSRPSVDRLMEMIREFETNAGRS